MSEVVLRPVRAASGPSLPQGGPPGAALGGGLAPAPGASLRLPGEHFAAALCFLTLGAVGVAWVAPQLAAGLYLSPHVAGVTHLFTLGWLTMTICGAIYQLLPVALGAPVRAEWMGHASFGAFVPGVAVFALGVMRSSPVLHDTGVTLLTIGIVLLATNVALSLPRAQRRDVTWVAMGTAVGFLLLTLALGMLLVHSLHTGSLGAARVRVMATHLHVALLGWVFMMIVGMSYRLLPMFLVAHGADTRHTARAVAVLTPGVLALAAGLAWTVDGLAWAGLCLVEAAVVYFLLQARSFFRTRMRKGVDAGLKHAATALGALALTAVLAPAVMAVGFAHPRLAEVYVMLGVLGAFSLYVIGLFYKIVPFLAWITRFRNKMGRERVPTVAQLYSSRVAHADLAIYVLAICGLICGVALGLPLVVRGAGVALVAAVLLFVSQMIRAAWGPVPAPAPFPAPGGKR